MFEAGDSLRLQFPKEDLGFTYHGDKAILIEAGGTMLQTVMHIWQARLY